MVKRTTVERKESEILVSTLDLVELPKSDVIKNKGFTFVSTCGIDDIHELSTSDVKIIAKAVGVSIDSEKADARDLGSAAERAGLIFYPIYKDYKSVRIYNTNTKTGESVESVIEDYEYIQYPRDTDELVGFIFENDKETVDDFDIDDFLYFLKGVHDGNTFVYDLYFQGKHIYSSGVFGLLSYQDLRHFTEDPTYDAIKEVVDLDDPEDSPLDYMEMMDVIDRNLPVSLPEFYE